jgi:hypothetical protein
MITNAMGGIYAVFFAPGFFPADFIRAVVLVVATGFSAQHLRVASMILRRPAALNRRFLGSFALTSSTEAAPFGLSPSTSRNAEMARSTVMSVLRVGK